MNKLTKGMVEGSCSRTLQGVWCSGHRTEEEFRDMATAAGHPKLVEAITHEWWTLDIELLQRTGMERILNSAPSLIGSFPVTVCRL
jgi:hypothetical protein